ncbi:NADH-ubiquinone oxidoreductase-F iron-sulfur binding region domain-containing protein [Agrilactobacillus yilanensis]|uniref:NADH-ubiquinone oxidoreductase-F iron-sulfur binding region domain-containing protein n=1 Tax=Agrilactobacillus yilanensis TaxID=2485997 RepID=A0ABW4JAF8_9LACO|nr:NADH-ubiquinone oxidoreductase-F iron-sulfur binding region domain-containing protein [Agrilactobacillus yilanensis]
MITRQPLTSRFGRVKDITDVAAYEQLQGYEGLNQVLDATETQNLNTLIEGALWSRSGNGTNVAVDCQEVLTNEAETKYIICNADEGEPGTFKDKALLRSDPLAVIEGMTIAAYLTHAQVGYIYVRGEFRDLILELMQTIENCRAAHLLGKSIFDVPGFDFDIKISESAGAYVCQEPAALFNAMSGATGRPGGRVTPTKAGFYKQPTLVEDAETFANLPVLYRLGAKAYQSLGTSESGGTKLVCLTGQVKNRGLFEVPIGLELTTILNDPEFGGGSQDGTPFKFIHLGGQSGMILPAENITDLIYSPEALQAEHLTMGTGAIVAATEAVNILDYLVPVARFFMDESCGKCPACRIGTVRIYEALQTLQKQEGVPGDLTRLAHMVDHVASQASCFVGQVVANPIFSAMAAFPEEFKAGVDWQAEVVKEVPW